MHNLLDELSKNFLTPKSTEAVVDVIEDFDSESSPPVFEKEHFLIDIITCELHCNQTLSSSDDLELLNPSTLFYSILNLILCLII